MALFSPAAVAAAWKRPYSCMQWAWVRALGVAPSVVWADEPRQPRKRKHERPSRDVRECFANERHVDLQDRS